MLTFLSGATPSMSSRKKKSERWIVCRRAWHRKKLLSRQVESPFRRRRHRVVCQDSEKKPHRAQNMPIENAHHESHSAFVQMVMGVAIVVPSMCVHWRNRALVLLDEGGA